MLRFFLSYLINTDECGDKAGNPDSFKVWLAEVLIELVEVVHGEEDTQQVDEDPQNIQDIVTERALWDRFNKTLLKHSY